jgi:hypothetical protein
MKSIIISYLMIFMSLSIKIHFYSIVSGYHPLFNRLSVQLLFFTELLISILFIFCLFSCLFNITSKNQVWNVYRMKVARFILKCLFERKWHYFKNSYVSFPFGQRQTKLFLFLHLKNTFWFHVKEIKLSELWILNEKVVVVLSIL